MVKYLKRFGSMLILVLSMASGTDIGLTQGDITDRIWSDGFEDGQPLTTKYEDVSEQGLSVTTADAFRGTHALEQHYDQGQVNAGWVCKVNNAGFPDHIFVRWYHKFEEGFEDFPPKMARARYRQRSGEWESTFAVHFWIDGGEIVADVLAKNSSQANDVGWLPIARSGFFLNAPENAGRWIRFEMEIKLNTPGQTDGLYRFWADDDLIIEQTDVDLRGNTQDKMNEVMLDTYWNGGSPKAQSRYYDDFVIATSRIGQDGHPRVRDLSMLDTIIISNTLTTTLSWTSPADSITYTLRSSDSFITEANWPNAQPIPVPFTASTPGTIEQLPLTIPYSSGIRYFALKTQNEAGDWSSLSNNAFWPQQDTFLPSVQR